ncbi:uncharacterized protein LOC112520396 [Cynara cardunculus var. scolymus]|uniref:uncharacterized protein LOC112520396 n=1 Tax=Cynara cardunculus var. scolymus TaxID=59895 RepID=UPI000D62C7ED|nr:uncharacterized protein LOC112520396 [Cynara cardunculus var. scolymus]
MSDTSNQPLQKMSDTSNQPLQEMFETSNPPLHEMSDTSSQLDSSEQSTPSYNHPCGDLLVEGRRRDFINICLPLYQASVVGDWEAVENILAINREFKDDLLGYSITEDKDTALTIAASSESIKFVENLVDRMTDQQLTLQDKHGQTALHIAAGVGNVDMAMAMVGKHPQLLKIRNGVNALPIYVAAIYGKHDMVAYLYDEYKSMAGDDWTVDDISNVFWRCIEADLFGTFLVSS